MIDLIRHKYVRAKKQHICNYCNCKINPGERYYNEFLKDGSEAYTWKSHKRCQDITDGLWSYLDPDEGLDSSGFQYGVADFARTFVCPFCPKFDKRYGECEEDKYIAKEDFCMSRIADCLDRNRVVLKPDEYDHLCYFLESRKEVK